VNYPGLASGGQAHIVAAQMTGPGGTISLVLDDATAAAAAVVDRVAMFAIAPSLGGVESIVTQPVTITHHGLDPAERAARGIVDSMIRSRSAWKTPAI
jgi:cystathionine gamma-synthase